MTELVKECNDCGVILTLDNRYDSSANLLCKDCIKKRSFKWKRENKKKVYITNKKQYQILRNEIMSLLGNKCVMCGNTDHRVLQIDHVNNDGYKERKKITGKKFGSGGTQQYIIMLKKIKKGYKGYQILCANCNQIKRYEYNKSKLSHISETINLKKR